MSKTYTLTWDSRYYTIYVNGEIITEYNTEAGSYTFKKGDSINVYSNASIGQITINGTTYTSTTAITLADQDIDITGKFPGIDNYTITIHT